MLTGSQLTLAIAGVLFATLAIGWILHWLWLRLSGADVTDSARLAAMVTRLHDAERARDLAVEEKDVAEALLADRESEMAAELAALRATTDAELAAQEAAREAELREARLDAETSMTGLRNARARIEELEAELAAARCE